MKDCKPVSTPMDQGQRLSTAGSPKTEQERNQMASVPYRSLIGSLLYLAMCTRPDIAFTVIKLSQFCTNPGILHWTAAKRLLRYLKGTLTKKLMFTEENDFLIAYSDADWASDTDDRRSYSGSMIFLSNAPILWQSVKQRSVAQSTMESEYVALSQTVKDVCWARALLSELQLSELFCSPTVVFCDSKSAIDFSNSKVENTRSRHIDIRYHYTREKINEGVVCAKFVPTEDNVADICTKGLTKSAHERCMNMILCD